MEFTFDKKKVELAGYTMESVYNAMKNNFTNNGLKCINDGETLVFAGLGDSKDYGKMILMMGLFTKQDWFLNIASSWIFRDNDGYEDILRQVNEKLSRGELAWRED